MNRSVFRLALICVPALAVLALPPIAAAQPSPAQSGAATAAQAVTRTQLSTQLDTNFKTIDSNGDQSLSAAEIEAVQSRLVGQAQANVTKRIETEFARLDSNKDGQLSLAEFKAGAPGPRVTPAADMLKQLDRNSDGKVGKDEFRATPLANFDRIDINKDGAISAEEQAAARSQR